ncbi:elongation factor 4 [Candidatus Uhrbacteria bacterium]|nr:elongation factor 4 [Candidatus Uhrbacteria bacterium]
MATENLRNYCIIAHIDHGKSTMADRFLELTGTISKREAQAQILDSMDLERERGITIKLQPVRMDYTASNGKKYVFNLIDTPGHVDFSYEVSRSLAAVEGALLLVDATQGIQAQTLANLYLAIDQGLTIIPVVNKVDLPAAQVEETKAAIQNLIGCKPEEILLASGKTGLGVPEILAEIYKRVPPPQDNMAKPLRAMIFDSEFDGFQGAVAYIRVIDGQIKKGDKIKFMATGQVSEVLEVGYFKPNFVPSGQLLSGEIGYLVTGLKEVEKCRVGDTVAGLEVTEPLEGYKQIKPMVFAGVFCKNGDDYPKLRAAIQKLKLSDAALDFELETSPALGFGFRCGFLGLLHLDIFKERLHREYNLDLIVTVPSVAYKVNLKTPIKDQMQMVIKSPYELPDPSKIENIEEPIMKLDVILPKEYIGQAMQMIQERRGKYLNTEYLEERALLHYELPLSALLVDFYDKLKSVSSGYASMNYDYLGYQLADVVRLDILVAEELAEPLSSLVYRDQAYFAGRAIVESLKTTIPRHMFEVKIQAAIGGKVIAADRIPAMRKDVLAKMSGGDYTRKRKLLEKQKEGKKKMLARGVGTVDIPPEAYLSVLKR